MSESHWGGRGMKGGAFALVGTVLLMAGLIALFAWSPWVEPTELDWVQSYEAWSERIESTLATGAGVRQASCEAEFDNGVGEPPTDRMEPAAQAARRGCAALSPEGWRSAQSDFVRALVDVHSEEVAPRHRRAFSEIAGSIAGGQAKVYCWLPERWAPFAEHYAIVRGGDEIWLTGIADTARDRIDVEPGVCATLGRYERRIRPPALSRENLDLAEALVILAHQAEHLKAPSASEQQVECYAVQHVRPLIGAAGWDAAFQTEIALHAWQLAYTQLPPQYQTPDCRNGGPLDRNPHSDAWP